jgi:hypothetical protein
MRAQALLEVNVIAMTIPDGNRPRRSTNFRRFSDFDGLLLNYRRAETLLISFSV